MAGMVIGTYVGGFIPTLFGADWFSLWSVIGNGIGGFLGIYIAFKLTQNF